jgi:hypothetical protein
VGGTGLVAVMAQPRCIRCQYSSTLAQRMPLIGLVLLLRSRAVARGEGFDRDRVYRGGEW